jgi:Xaa-Pro aminopeptidase
MIEPLPFTTDEFAVRIGRLRTKLADAGVAIGLFDEIEAMTWLAGFGNSENRWRCVGIPLHGDPFFLIRALDAEPCRRRIWFDDVVTFRDWEDPTEVLAATLAQRGLAGATIGLDLGSYSMNARRFEGIRAALPAARFVDLGAVVSELRLLKSPAKRDLIRRAAAVAGAALQRAAMRPGIRAAEVDAILREGVLAAGLRRTFDNITGYTLGLYAAATPRTSDFTRSFHPGADWSLETGMVFHMYVSAAGASFSETLLVTGSGAERLTRTPRMLLTTPPVPPT